MLDRQPEINYLHQIACAISTQSSYLRQDCLFGLFAAIGRNYFPKRELMWVGRVPNSWDPPGYTPDELRNNSNRAALVNNALIAVTAEASGCPLSWVTDSWPRQKGKFSASRCPFWQCAKQIAHELLPGVGDNWSSHLAWSNLYKVAPLKGGNPSDKLARTQESLCRDLLLHEVRVLQPKRLVITSGNWFHDFLDENIFCKDESFRASHVLEAGKLSFEDGAQRRYVIAERPEPRNRIRSDWIKSVLAAIH